MELRTVLLGLLAWVLYPLWLLAGAADYLCHRRTAIERTSGAHESWLHLAQLACIGIALVLAAAFEATRPVLLLMLVAVLTHSVLAFVDVSYTSGRRYISPFEQQVHGYLDVIPLIAVCLFGALHWSQPQAGATAFVLDDGFVAGKPAVLLLSFAVLAGVPVIEELIRALRARVSERNERHDTAHLTATSQR
jgi:hypothetical protein